MPIERRKIFYEGRVQGVGFRMTAARLASAHPLDGHVRNLPDGRVEIVVEGDGSAIVAFLNSVRHEFSGGIRSACDLSEPIDRPLSPGFTIRG